MLENVKETVLEACISMANKNLTVGTWGNISSRDPETGNIIVTPSGMDYSCCTLDDMIVYDKDGNWVEGERIPTIEKDMHIGIYQKRDDVNAVVHTHPLYATVFAVTKQELPAITEEFAQLIGKKVKCAEYALPGTMELAKYTADALGKSNAVLLTSHGALCTGPNMQFALRICDVLEKAAHIAIMAKGIGNPRIIPDEEVEVMQDFVKTKYGQR